MVNSGWEKLSPTEALQLPVTSHQIISYCSQTAPGLLIGMENTKTVRDLPVTLVPCVHQLS